MITHFLKLSACKILTAIATWQLWQKEKALHCEDPPARGGAEHLELFSGWEWNCSSSTETGGIFPLINKWSCRKQNNVWVFLVALLHTQQLTGLQKSEGNVSEVSL